MIDRFVDVEGGGRVYVREWLAPVPQAHILFIHGLGDHCSRYDPLFNKFAESGFSVSSFDLPGHGDTLKNSSNKLIGGHRQKPGHLISVDLVHKIMISLLAEIPAELPVILVPLNKDSF